jgi:hypothetical protein
MSRGPGRIERAIRELLDAHPDLAFVTDELVEHCYPGTTTIERKHQVSVLRAARKVIAGDRDWIAWRIAGQGRGWLFVNLGNLQSYALGRMIGDDYNIYRSKKRAQRRAGGYTDYVATRNADGSLTPLPQVIVDGLGRKFTTSSVSKGRFDYVRVFAPYDHLLFDRDKLLAELKDERHSRLIEPGGAWARQVQLHCARRDGFKVLADALEAQEAASMAAWSSAFRKRSSTNAGDSKETLNAYLDPVALADRIRELAMQNDPDALRFGLPAVAAELDRGGAK